MTRFENRIRFGLVGLLMTLAAVNSYAQDAPSRGAAAPANGVLQSQESNTPGVLAELTDGVTQWPATAALVAERLGPTAVVVEADHLEAFRGVLAEIGVPLELEPGANSEPAV